MSTNADTALANGLRLTRIALNGTRALTALVAFEAGSRTERAAANGIAHFLEHLVFKGGEAYPTHREINAAGERIGARVDAWTSQDMVGFRIRCRAEVAPAAIELLTDFVARPRLDPTELDRERGVVIQEIARADDRPQERADDLIDRAAFGEHPLGRPILGTEERLRSFAREDVVRFRSERWSGQRGCALLVGNLSHLPADDELAELFGRFPAIAPPDPAEPAPAPTTEVLVAARDSSQSHLRLLYRPAIDPEDRASRAALAVYRTLLGGSQGSLLFTRIREEAGLAYSVGAREHAFADGALVLVSAGLESARCAEAHQRIRALVGELATEGPDREHFERARAYAAGRLVLAFENTDRVADHAAEATVMFGQPEAPDEAIAALDRVSYDQVAAVAASLGEPAVACVGPHTAAEFA